MTPGTPHRIAIKLPFADATVVDARKIVPVFHRWIREHAIEGLLIDVADYTHVHHGPAAVLIAHEMDYVIDLSEGRAGFTYLRKRASIADSLGDDLRDGLRKLLIAAAALTEKPEPHGPVAFNARELRVQIIDRLRYPNDADTAARVQGEVEAALGEVYGGGVSATADRHDPRAPITLRASASGDANVGALLGRLQSAAAGA